MGPTLAMAGWGRSYDGHESYRPAASIIQGSAVGLQDGSKSKLYTLVDISTK